MARENVEEGGYASGFENALKYLDAMLPSREVIENGLRIRKTQFPSVAIREIIANALIHQDFTVTGAGPVIEVFSNRIEVTNPGAPLVEVLRILDNPPRSRNEKLAGLSRRLRMCEELGSGWDKIVTSCEYMQLPAPRIVAYPENTKVILWAAEKFSDMSQEDKLWTCYMHACIKTVMGEQLTNKSLRDRFGLADSSAGSISRLIKQAVSEKLIKPLDESTAPRYMKYVPIWA
jgi:predicted HTH transcriptional regulator